MAAANWREWHIGDKAEYVAGSPLWRDYIGRIVDVIHVGTSKLDHVRCATIRRPDTGDTIAVRADKTHTNIRPLTD